MKHGRDATRRNRNIGTARSGHGQNNAHVIPWLYTEKLYYENLTQAVERRVAIGRFMIPIIVEKTRSECIHLLSVDDIQDVLIALPRDDIEGLRLIVLRQPTRREETLHPVWARVAFAAQVGGIAGPAIFLDAQCPTKVIRWPKLLGIESQRELERLRLDGHEIQESKRHYDIVRTRRSCRRTFFRSIAHEVGHLVDYIASAKESPHRTLLTATRTARWTMIRLNVSEPPIISPRSTQSLRMASTQPTLS